MINLTQRELEALTYVLIKYMRIRNVTILEPPVRKPTNHVLASLLIKICGEILRTSTNERLRRWAEITLRHILT